MKLQSFLVFAFGFLFLSVNAQATSHITVGSPDTTTRSTSKVNLLKETPITLDLAAGVAVFNGTSMPGFNVGLYTRLIKTTPVYFGLETSAFFDTVGTQSALVPVLAGTYVEFEISNKVKSTLGLLAGPTFANNSVSGNFTAFSLLFRPGVNFSLAQNVGLDLQARFGVIGSSFVCIPQLGTAISFN